MLAVTAIWLCLSALSGQLTVAGQQSLWTFEKQGDIIIHALFPIRKPSDSRGLELNVEGITWMGAMVHRINQINEGREIPGNFTLGYSIRDTGSVESIGLRQTLSTFNAIINQDATKQTVQLPVVLGPATADVQRKSQKLYDLFNVPRIVYTTSSGRFDHGEKIIRIVPSDLIHIEALLFLLREMEVNEISVVALNTSLWSGRMKTFQIALKEDKNRIFIKDVIYLPSVKSISVVSNLLSCRVVVIFAPLNMSRLFVHSERQAWIQVSTFDDPLLRVFDTFGRLSKKVIVKDVKHDNVQQYKIELAKDLPSRQRARNTKLDWLRLIFQKHCEDRHFQMPVNGSSNLSEQCEQFEKNLISRIDPPGTFRSSLTLQGIIDGVNLVVASLREILERCENLTPKTCTNITNKVLFEKLRALNDEQRKTKNYSIQLLREVKDAGILGRRIENHREWIFEDVPEWPLSSSYLANKLRKYWNNGLLDETFQNNVISPAQDNHRIKDMVNSLSDVNNASCAHCDRSTNRSNCDNEKEILKWTDTWSIALYFLEFLCLFVISATFVYFSKHRNSPIMILCYSWPDDVILLVLGLFSLLPNMHIGEMAPDRCVLMWPVINAMFTFYCGLLLTKTLFIQNLLKCEVATDRSCRRTTFALLVTLVQSVILASTALFGPPETTQRACSSHGIVTLCIIEGNIAILISMGFNWLLMCALLILAIAETWQQRQNFCRTENLVAVATTGLISYGLLVSFAYFNVEIERHLAITLLQCLIYFANSVVCLILVYLPTLRLVSTWLRQHTRQQKNLTSIKRAQVISSKRHSSGPVRDSLFGANYLPEQTTMPSGRHSGYYFDLRPPSGVTDISYPTSLVRSVHEHTHVVFGYGRPETMSVNGATSVESVPSFAWLDASSNIPSQSSSYDNVSKATEERDDEISPEILLHEISTYWQRQRNSDESLHGDEEENNLIPSNQWPSLENLKTSDL